MAHDGRYLMTAAKQLIQNARTNHPRPTKKNDFHVGLLPDEMFGVKRKSQNVRTRARNERN